jgi:hypothetical protein
MYQDEDILDAARVIRVYLRKLVPETADELDRQIAGLLGRGATGDRVAGLVLAVLTSNPATREWVRLFLGPAAALVSRGFELWPGTGGRVDAPRYDCPQGDLTWYQPAIDTPVPECPTHGVRLVRHT